MSDFQPQTAFEGYIKGKLEDIEREARETKQYLQKLSERVTKNVVAIAVIETKAVMIGALGGILSSLGIKFWPWGK